MTVCSAPITYSTYSTDLFFDNAFFTASSADSGTDIILTFNNGRSSTAFGCADKADFCYSYKIEFCVSDKIEFCVSAETPGLNFIISLSGLYISGVGLFGVCANTDSYKTPDVPVKRISAKTIGVIFFNFFHPIRFSS